MDLLAQACRRRQKYGQRARSTLRDVSRRQSLQECGHQSLRECRRLIGLGGICEGSGLVNPPRRPALAPLIGRNLGVKKVPIDNRIEGRKRSAEIPGILHMSVDPLPTAHPSGEMWANTGHPVSRCTQMHHS
jgi:hypothetical protein